MSFSETVWVSPSGDLAILRDGDGDIPNFISSGLDGKERIFFMNPTAGVAWLMRVLGYENLGEL